MELIQVDRAKCIRCGICTAVCPMKILKMNEQGPEMVEKECIACGHCVAACPKAALDHTLTPLANQVPIEKTPVLDADTAERFLRARRSVRCYKPDAVPQEKIVQLLNVARLAPTAGNSQKVTYHVIRDAETLRQISAAVIDWMEQKVKQATAWAGYYAGVVDFYRATGQDLILRNAPGLIVALADEDFIPLGRDNAHFCLAYAELYAPSLGLGTCWAGFFEACAASRYEPLVQRLQLPEGKVVAGAIMVGYPVYTYQRLIDRNPLQVTWQ